MKRVLDIDYWLPEQHKKIEEEIRERFPNHFAISFSSLMSLDSFSELYYKAKCAGIDLLNNNAPIFSR